MHGGSFAEDVIDSVRNFDEGGISGGEELKLGRVAKTENSASNWWKEAHGGNR
jgi:hypothetical protein